MGGSANRRVYGKVHHSMNHGDISQDYLGILGILMALLDDRTRNSTWRWGGLVLILLVGTGNSGKPGVVYPCFPRAANRFTVGWVFCAGADKEPQRLREVGLYKP